MQDSPKMKIHNSCKKVKLDRNFEKKKIIIKKKAIRTFDKREAPEVTIIVGLL
jgi:hypothetical protein